MKTLKKFEFKSSVQASKYPWEKLLDGGIYQIEEGTDYTCTTRNMGGKVRTAAKKRYKAVRVSINEKAKTITLQATDMDAEQRKAEDARRAGVKERREAFEADTDVVVPCE